MKTVDGYLLYRLSGTNFLLPVGQKLALFKKGIQLNDTGALLWNAIKSGVEEKDLLAYLTECYGTEGPDASSLQSDIDSFIRQLSDHHLIIREDTSLDCNKYFRIAGLIIGYHGPEHLLHPSLLDFECSETSAGQYWSIIPYAPEPYQLGELIIRTKEIEILKSRDEYIITLTSASPSIQLRVSFDGINARFYCIPPLGEDYVEPLFHAFRHAFLLFAQKQGVFALHSSSVLYQDKVWLFSAPSGTGKTTQADYWKKLFQTRILNGDLNLIQFRQAAPIVSGLPWCGTSHIYSNETLPLGGIVLLKKYEVNDVSELSEAEQQLSVNQRLISPAWTEEMLTTNLEFSCHLTEQIPVFRYLCRNEPEAAHTLRQYIDRLFVKNTN